MNADALVRRLEAFAGVLPAAVAGVTAEESRFRPPSGAWSIVEIVNHLADEECEDFRPRLELVLRDAALPWPAIDPEGVAVARRYQERDLEESVARFVAERRASVGWLRGRVARLGADDPAWRGTYRHPKGWSVRAGDVFAAWAAHDALHLRQIAKRLYELAARDAGEFETGYAGEWKA